VHPEPQSFDFSHADQIVDFAIRHGIEVRGHTLGCALTLRPNYGLRFSAHPNDNINLKRGHF
jgi:hypothetical protein